MKEEKVTLSITWSCPICAMKGLEIRVFDIKDITFENLFCRNEDLILASARHARKSPTCTGKPQAIRVTIGLGEKADVR